MTIIDSIISCQNFSIEARNKGKVVGIVPTMGGLHQGHLSLIKKAKKHCDMVIVTIFLNPLQFAPDEALNSYPSNLSNDVKLCKKENVDAVFCPTREIMYGNGISTIIRETSLSSNLCGLSRPTHFDGVATVVTKLFNATLPHKAFFGEKDYQQLCLIKKLIDDLNFSIEVITIPIYREKDGLACSTRNQYLNQDERQRATILYKELKRIKKQLLVKKQLNTEEAIQSIKSNIIKAKAKIDYVEICHHQTLRPLTGNIEINIGQLFVAVFFEKTRLIDNIFLGI